MGASLVIQLNLQVLKRSFTSRAGYDMEITIPRTLDAKVLMKVKNTHFCITQMIIN